MDSLWHIASATAKPSKFRRILINSVEEDYAFAKTKAAQLQMLKEAFETGDDYKINQALLTIQYARESAKWYLGDDERTRSGG